MSSVVGVSIKIQGEDHGSGPLSQLKSLLTNHSNLGDGKIDSTIPTHHGEAQKESKR